MSTGLVLEGGGLRAIFTSGVVDLLLDEGIRFDAVFGVSAGACHACSFLSGQRGRAFRAMAGYVGDKRYGSWRNWLRTGDYFSEQFAYHELPEKLCPLDAEAYARNPVKLRAVATNCRTGLAEYPVVEDVLRDMDVIRASASLPLLSRMVPLRGELYLDGGISDSIPVAQSLREGNARNVVVLTRDASYRKGPNPMMPLLRLRYRRYPALVKAMAERHLRYNETMEKIAEWERDGSVFVVRPSKPLEIGRLEKDYATLEAGYRLGYETARELLPRLREYVG